MSQPAYDKYAECVAPGGYLVYDTTFVKVDESKHREFKHVGIGFTMLAEEIGNARALNMILLGFVNELGQCANINAVKESLADKFGTKKVEIVALNERAIQIGADTAKGVI